ncbi:glycosyltransferase [Oceaniglobus indicus]|uniref:glycosyltransferase n=1 Tax=Oceaniglobus indicus TaxID=2047749 RepID=UPI000C1794C8|nr:glycosyltransferase [Oceaniglobus indicus]
MTGTAGGQETAPTFSIVMVDYDGAVARDDFRRAIASLAAQTCDDFEVLIYHDGPKDTPYEDELAQTPKPARLRFFTSERREDDWGHSNRDRGIRAARGQWILHTNADNVLYPQAIERLSATVKDKRPYVSARQHRYPAGLKSIAKRCDKWFGTNLQKREIRTVTQRQIVIFAILLRGVLPSGGKYMRLPETAKDHALVMGGVPVRPGFIDAMQLVMRRDLWLEQGGWSDKRSESDGVMYRRFALTYDVLVLPEILGEHW